MQFTTLAISALSIGSALAQQGVTVHVVRVGAMNGSLAYYPNNVKAAVGDMVQFQFAPANHTVTQSTFDSPCMPVAMTSNVTGIYSGFMPVAKDAANTPTYTIMVKSLTPMWLYCSQGKHCQNGMTMVINENTKANASRTLTAYAELAKKATVNLPGAAVAGGASNTTTTPETGSGAGTGSGTTGGSTGTGTTSGSTTSSSAATVPGSSASSVRVGGALGFAGLVAAVFALVL